MWTTQIPITNPLSAKNAKVATRAARGDPVTSAPYRPGPAIEPPIISLSTNLLTPRQRHDPRPLRSWQGVQSARTPRLRACTPAGGRRAGPARGTAQPPLPPASPRQEELLENAYSYVLEHGLTDVSLRPLAAAIGSSPRVLLFLFGSKDGLVRALLTRARSDELRFIETARAASAGARPDSLTALARVTWEWLGSERHWPLLKLWAESYGRSLTDPHGPWSDFASQTVADWLALLAAAQPEATRGTAEAAAERTLLLAVLRGAFLDLLATGDTGRVTAAVELHLSG